MRDVRSRLGGSGSHCSQSMSQRSQRCHQHAWGSLARMGHFGLWQAAGSPVQRHMWQAAGSPVQRHRLPSKPFCRSSGVGSTPLSLHDSRAAWQATTKPGVQNPHCRNIGSVTQMPQSQEAIIPGQAGMAGACLQV